MKTLKPNGDRTKDALILIYIVLGVSLISIISDIFMYSMFNSMITGSYVSKERILTNSYIQLSTKALWFVTYIFSIITFILWFRRAYYNILQHVKICTWSEGWAAGCWFVPILNLFLPCQLMFDLHNKTNKFLSEKNPNFTEQISTKLIGWWWALWILGGLFSQLTNLISNPNSLISMKNAMILDIINNILFIINGFLVISIIKNYSKAEPLVYEIEVENIHPYLR